MRGHNSGLKLWQQNPAKIEGALGFDNYQEPMISFSYRKFSSSSFFGFFVLEVLDKCALLNCQVRKNVSGSVSNINEENA